MKNQSLWLVKIDRFFGWVLLAVISSYFVSGYGMAKGIMNWRLASDLHQNILPLIAIPSFLIHGFLGVRNSFIRRRIWNRTTSILLATVFLAGFTALMYFQLFYRR